VHVSVTTPGKEIRPISHWSMNDKVFALVRPFLDRGVIAVATKGAE